MEKNRTNQKNTTKIKWKTGDYMSNCGLLRCRDFSTKLQCSLSIDIQEEVKGCHIGLHNMRQTQLLLIHQIDINALNYTQKTIKHIIKTHILHMFFHDFVFARFVLLLTL